MKFKSKKFKTRKGQEEVVFKARILTNCLEAIYQTAEWRLAQNVAAQLATELKEHTTSKKRSKMDVLFLMANLMDPALDRFYDVLEEFGLEIEDMFTSEELEEMDEAVDMAKEGGAD